MDAKIVAIKDQAFADYQKRRFKDAALHFSECIQLLDENKDALNAAEMRNNFSVVLLELKQPDEALAALQGTDLIFAEFGDLKRQAMALGNMATALQAQGKLDEALTTFEASAELFKATEEKELRSITLKKIADLQLKTGKQYQALASLESSYDQQKKPNTKEKILGGFLRDLIKKITHRS